MLLSRTIISQPVDQPRVLVEVENDWLVCCED